jgi:hypothetical protein
MQRRCHTIMTPRPRKRDRFRELFSSSPSRLPDTNSTSQPGLTHSTCSMPGPPISGSTLSSSQKRHPSTLPQPSPDQTAVPVAQSASPPLPAGGQQVQLIDSTPISLNGQDHLFSQATRHQVPLSETCGRKPCDAFLKMIGRRS